MWQHNMILHNSLQCDNFIKQKGDNEFLFLKKKNRICAVKGIFKILFYCRFKGIIVANQSVSRLIYF